MTTRRITPSNVGSRTLGLRDVGAFLRRGAFLALVVAVVAGVSTYLLTARQTPIYEASVALLASQPASATLSAGLLAPSPVDPAVYQTALMESNLVPDTMTKLTGVAPSEKQVEAFKKTVKVSLQKLDISSVIRIAVDNPDPTFAATVANSLADGLITWDRDRGREAISATITALEQSLQEITTELQATGDQAPSAERAQALSSLRDERERQLGVARATSESAVVVGLLSPLKRATPPQLPIGPKKTFRTLVAVLLGLVLGYGLAFLRWALDPRVLDRDELAALPAFPVLAEFPVAGRRAGEFTSEAATFLRSNLMLLAGTQPPITVAVSSPRHDREKADVAVSLAESFARTGHRTLLVDANLRQPSTTHGLDATRIKSPPLEVYLENPSQEYEPASIAIGGKRSFDFVPSFTASVHPVELLSRGFEALIEDWRSSYDSIIVDCPPILPFADTLAVAPTCTGLVLCASRKASTRRDIAESLERLAQVNVRVLGSVLTDARVHRQTGPGSRRRGAAPPGQAEHVDPYRTLSDEQGMQNVQVRER